MSHRTATERTPVIARAAPRVSPLPAPARRAPRLSSQSSRGVGGTSSQISANELRSWPMALRAPDEPPVQVLGALAPAADVDLADARRPRARRARRGRASRPARAPAPPAGRPGRRSARAARAARSRAARSARCVDSQPPALVRPQVVRRRASCTRGQSTPPAPVMTGSGSGGRSSRTRSSPSNGQLSHSCDRRHAQRAGDAVVELLGGSRASGDRRDHNGGPWSGRRDFYAQLAGDGCPLCDQGRPEETPHGRALLRGRGGRRLPRARGHPARALRWSSGAGATSSSRRS